MFAILRVFVPPSKPDMVDVYKDIVHVFMGGLGLEAWRRKGIERWLFWLLSAWEVAIAVVSRM